jgi:D-xylose transport system substrate-binding protein
MSDLQDEFTSRAEQELVADFVSRRIDRRTLLARGAALGLSASAIASLVAAAPAGSYSFAADRRGIFTKTPPRLTTKVVLKKRPGDKKVKIAYALPSLVQFRLKFDQRFFREAVGELGDTVTFANANDDATLQASQVENMLTQGPDVLVIFPVSVDAAGTLATAAAKQAVKVVSLNYVIQKSKGVSWWIARDNVKVGRQIAEMAIKAKPSGNYVICSGDAATDVAQLKTKGHLAALKPYKGKIKVVSQAYNRAWDPAIGQQQIENALTATGGDIAAIICNYDGFMLAALQALPNKNKDGTVWIGGEDIFPEIAQAIVEGRAAMSSYTDIRQMARLAAQAAHELGNGRKPAKNDSASNGAAVIPGYRVNSFNITKANMCQFISEVPGWVTYGKTYKNIPANKRPPKC